MKKSKKQEFKETALMSAIFSLLIFFGSATYVVWQVASAGFVHVSLLIGLMLLALEIILILVAIANFKEWRRLNK